MRHSKGLRRQVLLVAFILFCTRVLADQVEIQWERQDGASAYDLEIQSGNEVVFQQRFQAKTSSWSGSLPFGVYRYRIRALNQDGDTGPWGEAVPFLATPNTPQPLFPPNKTTVIYKVGGLVTLRWSNVQGIGQFLLLLKGASTPEIKKIVTGNEVELPGLRPDNYSWTVTPILKIRQKKEEEAQFQIVEAKASEPAKFWLKTVKNSADPVSDLPSREVSLNLLGGFEGGTNYAFPMFAVKFALENGFALGGRYAYGRSSQVGTSVRYQSVRLNLSYYFSGKNFSDFFAQVGAGTDFISASSTTAEQSSRLSKAVDLSIGWQWKPRSSGFNFGLSLGGQYTTQPDITIIDVKFSGLLPLATLFAGYSF